MISRHLVAVLLLHQPRQLNLTVSVKLTPIAAIIIGLPNSPIKNVSVMLYITVISIPSIIGIESLMRSFIIRAVSIYFRLARILLFDLSIFLLHHHSSVSIHFIIFHLPIIQFTMFFYTLLRVNRKNSLYCSILSYLILY